MSTKTTLFIFVILFVSSISANYAGDEEIILSTNVGPIRPQPVLFAPKTLNKEEVVLAYLGIPYAEPPVGERRFRPPEPVQPWSDVLNATVYPPGCPQVGEPDFEFSEDCLYLNVYVCRTSPANAPVMVFLHGGGFTTGSVNDYSGVALAALGDVIVVILNYRLNIFGFFTTGDGAITPNLGLLDQRQAMQWVYDNIQAFGGDPQQITLFGESAGSAAVGWHILSEDSRRFFQRAILQSGVPLNPWSSIKTTEDVQETMQIISNIGQCGDTNVTECLNGKTTEELVSIVRTVGETTGGILFLPALEGDFFVSNISTLLKNGGYSDVDIMIGTTEDEGTYSTFTFTGTPVERPFITKDQFAFLTETTDVPLLTGLLEAIYADGIDKANDYFGAVSALLGDTWFTCGTNDFARQVAEAGSRVFLYRMTHEPMVSIWNRDWLGATHGEDLQFVFGLPLVSPYFGQLPQDVKMSFYIIQMWANFAKSGDPNTPYNFPRGISEWPQFNNETEMYKELDINFSNGQKLRQHQCNFWDNLLPQLIYLAEASSKEGWRPG